MGFFAGLYFFRNNKRVVTRHIENYLEGQIYSPTVLRCAQQFWDTLSMPAHESVSDEIRDLICLAPTLTDRVLQDQLNAIQIRNAIRILHGYQACKVPLTDDKSVPQTTRDLLSKKGKKALKMLENAYSLGHFTNQMTKLAVQSSNKILLDLDLFRPWHIDKDVAMVLVHRWETADPNSPEVQKLQQEYPDVMSITPEKDSMTRTFPALQLSQGCTNGCSHCMCCAHGPISHMPYPMFLGLHRTLFRYYKKYPILNEEGFWRFFYNSDTLDYQDPIIGADSGDVAIRLWDKDAPFLNFTKGIRYDYQRVALAKASVVQPTHLSFVDTPDEDMAKNMAIFQRTVKILEQSPSRQAIEVLHHHMKSGPTVNLQKYTPLKIHQSVIYAVGRARHFLPETVRQLPDKVFTDPMLIKPNGDLIFSEIKGGEHCESRCWNFFDLKPKKRLISQRIKKLFSR